jgi:chemotaxis protein histidine kinase CheA/CheY-like chemotaxis protein
MQAEQRRKITGYFIEEAKEHLETIEQGIVNFQSTLDDPETANEVYRAAHSIKGGAAMLELESIRHAAHRLEDYFKLLKETPVRVDETLQALCTRVLSALKELVGELERTFTVPEAIATRIMSAIEPVFEQIQTHIQQLLNPQISTTPGYISQTNDLTSLEPAPMRDRRTSRTPEVGEAELSTLADLFATSELESSLQDDNITLIQTQNQSEADEIADVLSFDTDAEFADLLEQIGGDDQNELLDDDEDISGFLDQLSSKVDSVSSSQAIPAPSSASDLDDELISLDELVGESATKDGQVDSSLDDLFGANFSFDEDEMSESPLETVPPASADRALESDRNGRWQADSLAQDLDALLGDLDTAHNAEDSAQQAPASGEDLELAEALFELTEASESNADFSLDTLTQAESNADFSLDTLIQDLGEPAAKETNNFLEMFSQDLGLQEANPDALDLDTTLDDLLGDEAGESVIDLADLEALLLGGESQATAELEATEASKALADLFGSPASARAEEVAAIAVDEETQPASSDPNSLAELLGAPAAIREPEREIQPAVRDAGKARDAKRPPAESPAPAVSQKAAAETSLVYYNHLDELEQLLEQLPAAELEDATLFAQLETLLDESIPTQLSPELAPESAEPAVAKSPASSGADDEFSDLEDLLKDIERQVGGPPTNLRDRARPRPRAATVVEQTLKVPVKQMDNLNNLMGELVVNRNSLEGDEDKLRQSLDTLMHQVQNLSDVAGRMQDLYERSLLEDSLLKSRQEYRSQPTSDRGPYASTSSETKEGYSALEMDSFTKFHELAQEVIELIVRVRESGSDIALWVDDIDLVARSLRQTTSQLQEGLTKARMVPFSRTADRLPLAVKKICPQLNKQAQLHVEGKETLIDKMILEHLSDPLTHLVNNSLTHGIESPEERIAKGKRPVGQITVRALQQGNQTVISVSDDGAGINPQRVKTKAIEKGLMTQAEARSISELEVYELLFHAGFSTKDQADNFAGRGVGLDVVRTSISEIRGNVNIESQVDKGTTFTIRLPLTLSISKALCCVSENSPMAFPMDGVEDMLDLHQSQIQTTPEGYHYIQWRDIRLHYCPLSELLTYHRKIGRSSLYASGREDSMVSVVVLRSATSFLAIGVDQVIGEQEIVIKQIHGPVPKPAGIAGATVQGDGRIMAIADVLELIQIAEGRMRKDTSSFWQDRSVVETSSETEPAEPMVLIVDDSITVRSLLSMTFEKAGYQVEQARDGQDAWEKLRGGLPCDIVFCDIEMPRVDGLELLGRLQKDEQLNSIPIAMLTSRGAERHRRVAAELGASGYFTKPYLEENLLDAAQRMIKGEVLLAGSTRKPGQKRAQIAPHPAELPTAIAAPPQFPPPSEVYKTPKVLIVDDSVTVRSLLAMTFEGAGYEVSQARDGQDAWNQLTSGLEPDVAFFDIEMPKMDGIQLLERIQKDEKLRELPVAMITSRGAQKMKQRAAERGASGYFTKPYVEQELLEAAKRMRDGEVLLEGSTRQPRSTPPTPEPVPSEPQPPAAPVLGGLPAQRQVLIVDDSVTVRSLLAMTFEGAGYEVAQARDGQDALKQLQSGLKADLIFLDIEMPRMDGITLLSHLQADSNLKNIPVAMLTSRGAKKMKQRAAEVGAKGYFVKPYVDEVLLDAAQRLIAGEVLLEVEA